MWFWLLSCWLINLGGSWTQSTNKRKLLINKRHCVDLLILWEEGELVGSTMRVVALMHVVILLLRGHDYSGEAASLHVIIRLIRSSQKMIIVIHRTFRVLYHGEWRGNNLFRRCGG